MNIFTIETINNLPLILESISISLKVSFFISRNKIKEIQNYYQHFNRLIRALIYLINALYKIQISFVQLNSRPISEKIKINHSLSISIQCKKNIKRKL